MLSKWLNSARANRGEINLMVVLVAFLGFGVLLFGTLSIVAFSSSQHANSILQDATRKSYGQGQHDQLDIDKKRQEKESESPFRSYVAPQVYGGFEVKFPKNWNAYLLENEASITQINMTLHPSFVKVINGHDNFYAAHVTMVRELYSTSLKRFDEMLKKQKITSRPVIVSGIQATWLEGKLDGKRDTILVIVPVRDKVINFSTDDKQYLDEFNQIIAQSNITP